MDAPEAGGSTQTAGTEGSPAPSQKEDGQTTRKASLKRKRTETKTKSKKPRKACLSRPVPLGYTVQQGEDMLLVISSSTSQYDGSVWAPNRKGGKKKKKIGKGKSKAKQTKSKTKTRRVRAKPNLEDKAALKEEEVKDVFVPRVKDGDHRWGQSLPEEVLINIFQMVVIPDGAVPFLCRVGRVCRLWNAAASSPVLWRSVTVGHCWIAPGRSQLPKTQTRIKDTVDWLAQNRFSQLRDFSLCHWKNNVDFTLEVVSQFCPHLHTLKLSHCSGVTAKAFQSLGLHSRGLQNINLQYSEFQVEGLLEYLESHGDQIRQLLFSHGMKNYRLMTTLMKGCCPDLALLEINTKLDSKDSELPICIQALQMACPKLKTFRMLNVRPLQRGLRTAAGFQAGFPLLEELCIATTSYSYLTDKDLWDVLFGSPRLRVLDLRGCLRITPHGLAVLPCLELECLFLGQHFTSQNGWTLPKKGLHMVTQKWSQTLRELDVANQIFSEEDLELAMSYLAQSPQTDTLRSLNLSGTKITPQALRPVVGQTTSLNYLNLSSCRYLPRGVKRVYRGQEDIRELLDKLD